MIITDYIILELHTQESVIVFQSRLESIYRINVISKNEQLH